MPKYVLGIDMNDVSTSACLVRDGQVVAGAQEERFNREKKTRRFPLKAIDWCLGSEGLAPGDVDAVAVPVNPAIYLENPSPAFTERARFRGELLYSPLNFLLGAYLGMAGGSSVLEVELDGGGALKIHYVRHHDAHAAGAYYQSPFDNAAIFTADAFGEKDSTVWYTGSGAQIERLRAVEFPYSVGCFYSAMTEFLGFRPYHDEWKIMGAAAHGDPGRYAAAMEKLISAGPGGTIKIDLDYFNYHLFHRPGMFSNRLAELLGEPYRDCERDERFFDIAAAAQRAAERVMLELMRGFQKETKNGNLCFSGGVAMNCLLNGKIAEETGFENVFVPPMPDDSGTSAGAALAVARKLDPGLGTSHVVHNSVGPGYGEAEIEDVLKLAKARYRRSAEPEREAARLAASGMVVGWYQGRMEFGERALGNRSILADPRDEEMHERITERVKFREPFRPFSPSVLAEHQAEWFESGAPVYFMEKAVRVKPEKRRLVPSVVHADGTARLQTVTRESSPLFYALIEEFYAVTGVPMVLNTSFNLRGEPIVESPRDALRTFYSCGIDQLVIGPFIISK